MVGRLVLSSLAAAVILFFFGFFWFGLSPMADKAHRQVPEAAVAALDSLATTGMTTGTYFHPFRVEEGSPEAIDAAAARFRAGPLMMIHYRAEGAEMMDPGVMAKGILHFFLTALMIGGLTLVALPVLNSWGRRVGFITAVGTIGAFNARLGEAIWYQVPWEFQLFYAGFDVVGWLLAGLAMAAILKPKAA